VGLADELDHDHVQPGITRESQRVEDAAELGLLDIDHDHRR